MSTTRRNSLPLLALAGLLVAGAVGGVWWARRGGDAATPPVYVALGASDAVGVGARQPSREGWVPLVHAGLAGGTQLVNLGINGATLDDVLQLELPVALDARPELVTLWPGPNDLRSGVALETFAERLEAVLAELDGLDGTTVVILTLPDLRYVPDFQSTDPTTLDARVREWNGVIAGAAARHGALLVDLYGAALELATHPDYISDDGFHPSNDGYRRIAELTLATIEAQRASGK